MPSNVNAPMLLESKDAISQHIFATLPRYDPTS